jgi:hypothetical protein
VQKSFLIETHADSVAAEETNVILDELQRRLGERLALQIAADCGSQRLCVRTQSNLLTTVRFGTEQKPEVSEIGESLLEHAEGGHSEVCRRDVERLATVPGQ